MAGFRLLFACFLFAVLGFGQSDARYTLRGSVVNALTGEPVRKASVQVNGLPESSVVTGSDGQFQVNNLRAGSYYFTVQKSGYIDSLGPGRAAQHVDLGPDTTPVVLKIVPMGRMTGRVLDTDGSPIPNKNVYCLRQAFEGGHKGWQPGAGAGTDGDGNFTIDSLEPGDYLLSSSWQPVYPGWTVQGEASRLIFPREYYPNASDIGSGEKIHVGAGETAQADLTLPVVRATKVFFSVVPAQQWVTAEIRNGSGEVEEEQPELEPKQGGWSLPDVRPGDWQLEVRAQNGAHVLWGGASIHVGATDVRNVVIEMTEPADVPITFSGSPAASAMVAGSLQLVSDFAGQHPGSNAFADLSGERPRLTNVTPGSYRVRVNFSNGANCVESITSGASDLARVDYVVPVGGSPQPINIGQGTDCGQLQVSARPDQSPTFFVVITGGVHAVEPMALSCTNGFAFTLAPGEYDVYAFADGANFEYANSDVLKNFSGQHVTIAANATAKVNLVLNDLDRGGNP